MVAEEKGGYERDEAALAEARQKVYGVFDELGIPYEVFDHPPIHSAAERKSKGIVVDGAICKNLFLCNKERTRYYLFVLPLDKRADLKALQSALGETRLSFGDADMLWELLRITPGSVSLLNIIGAYGETGVAEAAAAADVPVKPPLKFLIDAETLAVPRIGLHPNDNAATIVFSAERLPDILGRYGAEFAFLNI